MTITDKPSTYVAKEVTYTVQYKGVLYVVENVPAEVCELTGERLFSPDVVQRVQEMIWNNAVPARKIEATVYDYAA